MMISGTDYLFKKAFKSKDIFGTRSVEEDLFGFASTCYKCNVNQMINTARTLKKREGKINQ
jgi:hypothetical protein